MKIFLIILSFLFFYCGQQNETSKTSQKTPVELFHPINPAGAIIKSRVNLPPGYSRMASEKKSFGEYLQNLPLKPDGSQVYYYNGEVKSNQVHTAVVEIDVGTRDLQQCADAVMRLWGEYHFKQKQFDKIHFNFTNGFRVDYSQWIAGNRIKIKGNKTSWVKLASPSNSYKSFRKYMNLVFAYAGTLSLSKELIPVSYENMQIGDVFIQGGSPGHAVIVVDMATNEITGEKLFLLAQSYMPAQDIHILKNHNDNTISPWYKLNIREENIDTPEWEFKTTDMKRFGD